MGGDPIPGPLDILGVWFRLRDLSGEELDEAIERLEEWLRARCGRAQGADLQ